jgi:hypothetical protein
VNSVPSTAKVCERKETVDGGPVWRSSPRVHRGPFVGPAATVSAGCRLLIANLKRKLRVRRRYEGSAAEICEQIVRECFDPSKRYFRTSTSSYPDFWARDFGRCVPALLSLGFEPEVGDTYRYALERYETFGHFALVVTPAGRLLDFPGYAPDGFAFFLMGLARLGDRAMIARHRRLLEREVERFAALVIDPGTGLVRRGVCFSEAQDYAVRDSSCYSNSVCYLLQQQLDSLRLPNVLARYDYSALLLEGFWDQDHFLDDLSRPPWPSGDAQVLPFWTGLLGRDGATRRRFDAVLRWMDGQGLNDPLPCRYGIAGTMGRRMHVLHRLNPWQLDTVWTCLGLHLLEVLRDLSHDRFPVELDRFRLLVERLGCFPEILDPEREDLYEGALVVSEDSMLWAANLWSMLDRTAPDSTPHSGLADPPGGASPQAGP